MALPKVVRLDLAWDDFSTLLQWAQEQDSPEGQRLNRILQNKLNKLVERDLYNRYKSAPTEQEREEARQAYLERKGIPQDFRW